MSNKAGARLSPRLARILQRRAVADRWQTTPVEIGEWPHGEVLLEAQLIEMERHNRPANPPPPKPPMRKR